MQFKAVIFDLFDVLFLTEDFSQHRAYEQRMGLPENGLLHTMLHPPQFREAVTGHISASELWQDVALRVGDDPQNWQQIANIFFSAIHLNTELLTFIRTLRPRYKTAILSNAPYDIRTQVTQRFRLEGEVDTIIISAEEKMSKPQPEIFHLAANRLQVHPQEAIFVDDEIRFIEGAQAIGMAGVQFRNNQQAILEIQKYLDTTSTSRQG
jgi:epoxide hydrolase-like predicted phosphatase